MTDNLLKYLFGLLEEWKLIAARFLEAMTLDVW